MKENIHPRTATYLGQNLFNLAYTGVESSNVYPFLKSYLEGMSKALNSLADDIVSMQRIDTVMNGLKTFMINHNITKVLIPVNRADPKRMENLLGLTSFTIKETAIPRGYGEATRVSFTAYNITIYTDICSPTESEYQRDVSPASYKGVYKPLGFLHDECVEIGGLK